MADQPVQILTPAEQLAANEIKSLVMNVALKAALTSIEAQAPFLRLPIIKEEFEFLSKVLVTSVYGQLDKIAVFDIVDIRDEKERAAYDSAESVLKAALTKGDKDGVQKAREDFEKTIADLVHFPSA